MTGRSLRVGGRVVGGGKGMVGERMELRRGTEGEAEGLEGGGWDDGVGGSGCDCGSVVRGSVGVVSSSCG